LRVLKEVSVIEIEEKVEVCLERVKKGRVETWESRLEVIA
jgi:hypothetical protein